MLNTLYWARKSLFNIDSLVLNLFTPPVPYSVLLLLSHFSRVRLCATPQTAAHQGFSRQEHCSGLSFPSMHESESEVAQLCPSLSNPMDCSPPGSSIHRIFQARILEWGAIAFTTVQNRSKITDQSWLVTMQLYKRGEKKKMKNLGSKVTFYFYI